MQMFKPKEFRTHGTILAFFLTFLPVDEEYSLLQPHFSYKYPHETSNF